MPYQADNVAMGDKTAVRDALAAAHRQRLAAEAAELAAVAAARSAGVTWEEIGAAVGMAGPNAHRKYSKLLVETRIVEVAQAEGQQ